MKNSYKKYYESVAEIGMYIQQKAVEAGLPMKDGLTPAIEHSSHLAQADHICPANGALYLVMSKKTGLPDHFLTPHGQLPIAAQEQDAKKVLPATCAHYMDGLQHKFGLVEALPETRTGGAVYAVSNGLRDEKFMPPSASLQQAQMPFGTHESWTQVKPNLAQLKAHVQHHIVHGGLTMAPKFESHAARATDITAQKIAR